VPVEKEEPTEITLKQANIKHAILTKISSRIALILRTSSCTNNTVIACGTRLLARLEDGKINDFE